MCPRSTPDGGLVLDMRALHTKLLIFGVLSGRGEMLGDVLAIL